MRHQYRKTTPKVKAGKVQRKNRSDLTPNYHNSALEYPMVDRRRPSVGYRHILRKDDVERFIRLLPDWAELAKGLNAVVLAPGDEDCDGWHTPGIVAVCAWERELRRYACPWWFDAHRAILQQIGVPCEPAGGGVHCQWTESTIRAYQLTHVLLHELGHHHDRMTTRSQRRACRGEAYAERYAIEYADLIWTRFLSEFGLP